MGYSPLITGKVLTNNHSGQRTHAIDTITPHYMAGYATGTTCAESFVPAIRRASANYCIGRDGDIVLNVDEDYRAWTTGSAANDQRAITLECANYMDNTNGHVYGQLPDATWRSLVELCADICRRHGKTRLVNRPKPTYDGLGPTDMLLTRHCDFQDTDCPGPWFIHQFDRLANEVNERLGGAKVTRVHLNDVAARIHFDITSDDRNGYSQEVRWGGDHPDGTKHLTINGLDYEYRLGSYDCASSVITAWRQAIRHTPYEGRLDNATYTGDMEGPFVASGLFTSKLSSAKRGDLYLRPKRSYQSGHVAMCQEGDGEIGQYGYGYDALSEMYWNELGGATGGRVGDQTGQEGRIVPYYNLPWSTVLHYNGKGDFDIRDETGGSEPVATRKADEMVCILQAGENGQHLYYFDGTRARHISPVALSGIQKAWQGTHDGGLITVKTLTQDEIDAMCAL